MAMIQEMESEPLQGGTFCEFLSPLSVRCSDQPTVVPPFEEKPAGAFPAGCGALSLLD
jgi:hypothetical protein